MPLLIWRSTLLEFWRILLLTTLVLVTIASFGASVKWLAAGKLHPLDSLRFMLLAMPPMLQYTLPFAAAFAASLTYHRMAQDNEATAARSSGVSQRSLLVPAAVSGLVLAGIVSLLSEQVIPRFLRSMEEMLTEDLARVMVSVMGSGQALEIGDTALFAERVDRLGPEGDAFERLLLTRMVAIQYDREGVVQAEVTSQYAWVLFFWGGAGESGGRSMIDVQVRPGPTRVLRRGQAYVDTQGQTIYRSFPRRFDDDPKFLTWRELRDLPRNPDTMSPIDARRRNLAFRMAGADVAHEINAQLATQGQVRLQDAAERILLLRAGRLTWEQTRWRIEPPAPGAAIEVEVVGAAPDGRPDTASMRRFEARSGFLEAAVREEEDTGRRRLELSIELVDVTTRGPSGASSVDGRRESIALTGLIPRESALPTLLSMSSADLLAEVDRRLARPFPQSGLAPPARDLRSMIASFIREGLSKQHERAAMSVCCLVMVVTGAVTASRLGQRIPLVVYLWAFFPALIAMLTISAGQQMVYHRGHAGIPLIWSGNVLLATYAGWAYWRVRRH